jgi:AcrR family transcriptional regulator
MSRRVVEIARRTLVENDFSEEIIRRVQALIAETPDEAIRLMNHTAPDADAWDEYTQPYLDQNWLTPPWFFTETYFYRRLIEATGFYEVGSGLGVDPFHYQKEQGLLTTGETIRHVAARLDEWIASGIESEHIAALLAIDLWGNRADLSLWPADHEGEQPKDVDWQAARAYTLADDTETAVNYLSGRPGAVVDFLNDNAGLELVADLALADYLLSTGAASQVKLHLKPHPTFVSDAMIGDVLATADFLAGEEDEAVARFGARLQDHVSAGRLLLKDDAFWVSPLPMWQMPQALRQALGQSDLVISKGDANYRRLLGDREWPYTTPFAGIVSYMPVPLLALRTLKAELACGLAEEQVAHLNEEEADWLVNGRYGVIQFALPPN